MAAYKFVHLALAGVLATGIACTQETEAEREAERMEEQAERAGDRAEDAADRAGDRAENAAERAGNATAGAAQGAVDGVKGAVETADVKMALTTDDTVDASDIDVDSNHETRVVTLKGFVSSAAQRERAETIAKREAEGYQVVNQLVVRAR